MYAGLLHFMRHLSVQVSMFARNPLGGADKGLVRKKPEGVSESKNPAASRMPLAVK